MRIFHVTLDNGTVYGVAANGKREAKSFAQERMTRDEMSGKIVSATDVGPAGDTWTYGAVLWY